MIKLFHGVFGVLNGWQRKTHDTAAYINILSASMFQSTMCIHEAIKMCVGSSFNILC